MFERFTRPAREVVVGAQEEARGLRHRYIGTEHLLLALTRQEEGVAHTVLRAAGVERVEVLADIRRRLGETDDAEALRSIGIDLDAVRARVEETFGEGALDRQPPPERRGLLRRLNPVEGMHIPFTGGAKLALELALREALALKHKEIAAEHILLGVVREGEGIGGQILAEVGLTPAHTRSLVQTARRHAA